MADSTDVSPVTVPGPRAPLDDVVPISPMPPARPAPPARRRRTGLAGLLTIALLAVTGLAVAGLAVFTTAERPAGMIAPAAVAAAPIPLTPFELAIKALDAQAAALLRSDQAGWLAVVDPAQPALRKRYLNLYTSLRALHVTQFEYRANLGGTLRGTVVVNAEMAYCFSATTCPSYVENQWSGPPRVAQQLTLKAGKTGFVISRVAKSPRPSDLQPTPWEAGDLVYAQGKRVTVGAPRALAKRLPEVVAVADRAASVDDRFAGYVGNPQQRYRIFLATGKNWTSWYGGRSPGYWVAYTIQLNDAGSDVVLNVGKLGDGEELAVTIQHELGHVATLSDLEVSDPADMWLKEGVAEYIGWLPRHARSNWSYPSVHALVNGAKRPKSIVAEPLSPNASPRSVDAFYGLGHYAVECLVTKFGVDRAMDFVRLRLRLHDALDVAARGAFGKSFTSVDKACVNWIRQQAG